MAESRCNYCQERKSTLDMALMAPSGHQSKWVCFPCLDEIEMYFMELAEAGCEACAGTVEMLKVGRQAREFSEQTGAMALVEVPPNRRTHRDGCPVNA